MIKRKIAMTALSVLTIILEILPYGAICIFMDDGGIEIRRTFSYFSLVPYGYANFSPLITAVLSCVILVLCVVICFRKSQKLNKVLTKVSGSAAVISFMPFFYWIWIQILWCLCSCNYSPFNYYFHFGIECEKGRKYLIFVFLLLTSKGMNFL